MTSRGEAAARVGGIVLVVLLALSVRVIGSARAELVGLRWHRDCIDRLQEVFEVSCQDELTDPEPVFGSASSFAEYRCVRVRLNVNHEGLDSNLTIS